MSLRALAAGVLLPEAAVPADWYDCRATAIQDRSVASAGIEGSIAGHGADLLIGRDLVQQVQQNGAVAFPAWGKLRGTDVAGGSVDSQMHLAVLAPAIGAVLAGQPSPLPRNLIPVLSTSRFRGPGARRCVICTVIVFCLRLRVEKSGTGQSRPAILMMLAAIPPRHGHSDQSRFHGSICRSGRPNRTFTMRQNCTAASENTGERPGRPASGANQTMSLSSQTSNEPRRFSTSL